MTSYEDIPRTMDLDAVRAAIPHHLRGTTFAPLARALGSDALRLAPHVNWVDFTSPEFSDLLNLLGVFSLECVEYDKLPVFQSDEVRALQCMREKKTPQFDKHSLTKPVCLTNNPIVNQFNLLLDQSMTFDDLDVYVDNCSEFFGVEVCHFPKYENPNEELFNRKSTAFDILNGVISRLPRKFSVLDVGCGPNVSDIKKRYSKVSGHSLDVWQGVDRQQVNSDEVVMCEFQDYKDKYTYDLVVAFNSFTYMLKPENFHHLASFVRPGGFIFGTMNLLTTDNAYNESIGFRVDKFGEHLDELVVQDLCTQKVYNEPGLAPTPILFADAKSCLWFVVLGHDNKAFTGFIVSRNLVGRVIDVPFVGYPLTAPIKFDFGLLSGVKKTRFANMSVYSSHASKLNRPCDYTDVDHSWFLRQPGLWLSWVKSDGVTGVMEVRKNGKANICDIYGNNYLFDIANASHEAVFQVEVIVKAGIFRIVVVDILQMPYETMDVADACNATRMGLLNSFNYCDVIVCPRVQFGLQGAMDTEADIDGVIACNGLSSRVVAGGSSLRRIKFAVSATISKGGGSGFGDVEFMCTSDSEWTLRYVGDRPDKSESSIPSMATLPFRQVYEDAVSDCLIRIFPQDTPQPCYWSRWVLHALLQCSCDFIGVCVYCGIAVNLTRKGFWNTLNIPPDEVAQLSDEKFDSSVVCNFNRVVLSFGYVPGMVGGQYAPCQFGRVSFLNYELIPRVKFAPNVISLSSVTLIELSDSRLWVSQLPTCFQYDIKNSHFVRHALHLVNCARCCSGNRCEYPFHTTSTKFVYRPVLFHAVVFEMIVRYGLSTYERVFGGFGFSTGPLRDNLYSSTKSC